MTSPAAIYLQDAHPIKEGMEYTKYAEEKGFEAVWQADSRLVRDAIVPTAALATQPAWPQHFPHSTILHPVA